MLIYGPMLIRESLSYHVKSEDNMMNHWIDNTDPSHHDANRKRDKYGKLIVM